MRACQTLPLREFLPLSQPQFSNHKIRGWMVGSKETFASDLFLTAMCEPIPAFLPPILLLQGQAFLQPRVSLYIMVKKEPPELTSKNAGVSDGRKSLLASSVCQCCSQGQAQCQHLPAADSLGWLSSNLTNPTSSSLPLWPWMALRTS